ncbi:MAG: ATP-binding protein [Armatimonadota bacterium]|nr:ATP-binding protein [Armatimonadota bacterium]
MENEEVLIQAPALPAYISMIRHVVAGVARRMSFTSEQIGDLKLAVGEACNNAVRHGCDTNTHPVRIRCRIQPSYLQIEVRNRYCGVPPDGAIGAAPLPQNFSEGGMGIYLMKTLVDRVDFRWGKSTATVRLTKNLGQARS